MNSKGSEGMLWVSSLVLHVHLWNGPSASEVQLFLPLWVYRKSFGLMMVEQHFLFMKENPLRQVKQALCVYKYTFYTFTWSALHG